MKKKNVAYNVTFNENSTIIKCTLTKGRYINEWIEISNIKFLDEKQDAFDLAVSFDFNSSLGDMNQDLLHIAQTILNDTLNELPGYIKNENRD